MELTNLDVKDWFSEIEDAKKRDKDFETDGKSIIEIYNGKRADEIPFNILYSNTETLKPAVYSQTPRPVVKRRFNQEESPIVEAVEKAGTRILEYFLDTNIDNYEKFDDAMSNAVLDAALPGRGFTQIKFDGDISDDAVKSAFVCADSRKWNRVYHGFGTKWQNVPWIAFEEHLDKEECEELFEKSIVDEITFSETEEDDKETNKSGEKSSRNIAIVYQIWDKNDKKVKWITESYDGFLKEQDDPLEITGFFPCPKPLMFHKKSNDLMPTALYSLYENQAKELNRITVRLNRIIEAIKFRGVYDGEFGDDLEKLLDEDDNALIPTEKGAAMVEGGFDKSIWIMPVEKLAGVAQALFEAREQCKRVIYEITGLSDIVRGMSRASETLGAQQIKESWGTMRLKTMQKDVQIYVRDTMRIMLDVASMKIPQRFWPKLTGLKYPTNSERNKAKEKLNQLKAQMQEQSEQQYQQMVAQAQQQGQPAPDRPPPPPPPPELMQIITSPSWEEILEVLKDDYTRSYKIDIETNSTLDIEATEDQKQVGEFMNAMAQFMNGIMPMVQSQIMPFGAMKSMLLEIARRFRFGIDVEDQIKSMKEPEGPNPEQAKEQQKQMQEAQKQIQAKQQELQGQEKSLMEQRQSVGDQLDQRANKLAQDEMQFAYDKKLFEERMKLQEQLNNEMLKLKDQAIMNDVKAEREKAEMAVTNITQKAERNIQSMLDKTVVCVKEAVSANIRPEV